MAEPETRGSHLDGIAERRRKRLATVGPRKKNPLGAAPRTALALLMLLTLALVTSASGCPDVDKSAAIIQGGVDAIDRQPGAWDATMKSILAQLKDDQSGWLDQVQELYSSAIGQAQAGTMCTADFFGRRVEQRLQAILHKINPDKYKTPVILPVVGNTNPAEKVEADKTSMVTFYGYDFQAFDDINRFNAVIRYGDGTVANAHFGYVAITSNYQMSLQFQGYDFRNIDRTRGPQVVLCWGSKDVTADSPGVQSSLPLIIPSAPVVVRSYEDWRVEAHASNWGHTTPIDEQHTIDVGGGWRIDRTQGDAGHAGISLIRIGDNKQGRASLRADNYWATSDTQVRVKGEITGDSSWGPGAIYDRTYRIFLIKYE